MTLSSTYSLTFEVNSLGKSLICGKKSCGPNAKPCGTLEVASTFGEPLTTTDWYKTGLSTIQYNYNLCTKISCGTVSNAFWKSRNTEST